jgi:hypothetical protein
MPTLIEIKDIVLGELDPRIDAARCMNDKLRLHVDGVGMQKYLAKINNYENESQFEARQKHAISNKAVVEDLLRNVDNAFSARGGSKTYEFTSDTAKEEFIKQLTNVKGGLSMSQYIEQVWFHNFLVDPNGLTFIEIPEEGSENNKALPTYKSIHSIRAYEQNGIHVDWVIFEPHVITKGEDKEAAETITFWYVNSDAYYLYEVSGEDIKELQVIPNSFEKVPAVLCSNLIDPVTGWKKSPIDAQVELLNKHLVSNSVLSIAEFFHNYPQQWIYIDDCNKCSGSGSIQGQDRNRGDIDCPSCNGTGQNTRKDVTDSIKLKIPRGDEQKIAPDISGFITMPTEAWKLMTDSVDRSAELIYYSHWGTTQEAGDNETATGRFIDVQPVNNRLDRYSSSIELIHTNLVDLLGEFYYPETFERAFIQYGRRYLIETPDQIWDKYLKSKEKNAPITTLDLLLAQFLESEFRENGMAFAYEMKKVKLEPFVHWDIVTVKSLGVAEVDYKKKLYFSDWMQTKTIKEVIDGELKTLDKQLEEFANSKSTNINIVE